MHSKTVSVSWDGEKFHLNVMAHSPLRSLLSDAVHTVLGSHRWGWMEMACWKAEQFALDKEFYITKVEITRWQAGLIATDEFMRFTEPEAEVAG